MENISASGQVEYECVSCQQKGIVDIDKLEWELMAIYRRKMGMEQRYIAEINSECSCGQQTWIELSACEYPVGVISDQDMQVRGATRINKKGIIINIA